ncbi:hypothetical protein [Haloquadratum walsbyi]|uniref:Uncharacterized protein n=1 Tax=Haloquadratum walsbyi J07HQW2 TaxID=1238425 RepID=U1MZE2_9EURY|nr:hypothetical protein [Haloquadratum walsbyi]ERG95864.1 MAG: hypothetical protein J07HQW2_02324 [Haloquadratum walsbyi J07HQW2]
MPQFEYPCPDCRSTSSLHASECQFEGTPWSAVEKAYTDIIIQLTAGPIDRELLPTVIDGEWSALHNAAIERLTRDERVTERNGIVRLRTAEEFREEVSEPTREPMRTIYQQGSVPGCHDNAVFAMIAWYEMVGLSWRETRENVITWLEQSGAWARGGFDETTPAELVDDKRHVFDAGYGWKEKAQAAKRIIDRHH